VAVVKQNVATRAFVRAARCPSRTDCKRGGAISAGGQTRDVLIPRNNVIRVRHPDHAVCATRSGALVGIADIGGIGRAVPRCCA